MDGFHFSRVLPWHFSLVFWGLDSTVSQDTISVVFRWTGSVGFRRIGIRVGFSGSGSGWFFVGSDSVDFSGSGYSVFCRIGLGFSSLDLRFF